MEMEKLLKHVSNLNEYISVSQKVLAMPAELKIQFKMSTVLSLKKVRALEIEHFNKCVGKGAALLLFERIVELPPSKTWVMLGKELVLLLQYWLDAMRKHLVKHNHNWWNFMKILLKFIKFIRIKDPSLPNILLEYTAECLLDLATGSVPDIQQRLEIIVCLNLCCQDSRRETRMLLRDKLDNYLLKLSKLLASCGHWPTQCVILENLMRWLVPRHDPALKRSAASKWFPERVFGENTVKLFLEREWYNFYQDARHFLNSYNDITDLVVSVVCHKVDIGSVILNSGTERREYWLDVNCNDKSVSMVVYPEVLETVGYDAENMECLVLNDDNILQLQITKESLDIVLSVQLSHPPRTVPGGVEVASCVLKAVVSPKYVNRLDRVLRNNYNQRYKLSIDLFKTSNYLSPPDNSEKKTIGCTEEDTRFSHPDETQKRKRSGYVVRSRNPAAWKSPSSVSTSSLAQLHEKLAQLPRYDFEKEAVHVCALPELSTVTEVSETDDRQSFASVSTVKVRRPFGVCQKNFIRNEKNSQSDGEIYNKPKIGRYLSPAEKIDENSTSCLLVATIGSDESVINETIEHYSKTKDFQGDNIVDLIVQEALQSEYQDKDKFLDSGINTGDNRKTLEQEINSEAIENTPAENPKVDPERLSKDCPKPCTVISNTTTDESNDVVYDTPLNFVNVRKRQKELKPKEVTINKPDNKTDPAPVFDEQTIENFFTQHLNENQRGEVVISPTLARKINESSSDTGDHFDDCLLHHEDVIENNVEVQDIDNNDNVSEKEIPIDENIVHADQQEIEVNNIEQEKQESVEVEKVDSNIVHEQLIEIQDVDIIDCLNSMVDKVCNDLEKCTELMDKDFNNIHLNEVQNQSNVPLKDTTNLDKTTDKEKVLQKSLTPKRAVKLKYSVKKLVKKRANPKSKNNKLELESVSKMSPIVEAKSSIEVTEKEKTPESKDSSSNKSDCLDVPLIRRKRKLYSPKDENNAQKQNDDKIVLEDEEDNDFKATKITTPNYKATCYKDIEEDRQKKLRKPRFRKSYSKSERTPSPRTMKMNDIFDHLKDKIESNDSIKFADKKQDKDLAVYNFTSDSEDEDFKKKKVEVQKRMSTTTIASGDSSMSTRHGRQVNRVNYSESKSSDETRAAAVTRPKRTRRKRQTKAQQIKKEKNLLDEKMRKVASEELNTSLVLEKPVQKPTEEPELIMIERPEMEAIPDEVIEVKEDNTNKRTKKNKKTDVLSLKKDKTTKKESNYKPLQIETIDDGKESPLPALLVEAIPEKQDEINDSMSVNIIKKLQKIQQEGPETSINETNTTQNLLSDVERINYSPPWINVTDEFNKIESEAIVEGALNKRILKTSQPKVDENVIVLESESQTRRKSKHKERTESITQNANEYVEVIEISCVSEVKSDKSITTVGKSPITAHGDSNEAPPDTIHLTQDYKHRDIEIEDLDQSIKDYFNKLREEAADIPKRNPKSNSTDTMRNTLKVSSSLKEKSPVVSISRLSIDDISKWLPSRRNSDTDSYNSAIEPIKTSSVIKNEATCSKIDNSSKPKKNKATVENIDNTISEDNLKDSDNSKTSTETLKCRKNKKESKTKYTTNQDDYESDVPLKDLNTIKKQSTSYKILEKVREKYTDDKPLKTKKSKRSHKKNESEESKSPVQEKLTIKNINKEPTKARKSIISPIKLFGDIFPTPNQESSDDENLIPREIHNQTLNKKSVSSKRNLEKEFKNCLTNKEDIETSSLDSKLSASTRKIPYENKLKRKSDSPVEEYVKRRRLEKTEIILSGSNRSVSSVNEWFRKMAPVDRAENIHTSLTEAVNNVMEKLDTTLMEIHQNTSKKFIHMFVNAQKHLAAVKQERKQMFRSVAAEILADVVKVIDAKFADLDQRSQEMDAEFMKKFKSEALELIREDCKKKQVMVTLLREDVQAVLDHTTRARKGNY